MKGINKLGVTWKQVTPYNKLYSMKKIAMFVASALLLASCACGSNHDETVADSQIDSVEFTEVSVDTTAVADTVAVDTLKAE